MQNRVMTVMEEGSNPIEEKPVYCCCMFLLTMIR